MAETISIGPELMLIAAVFLLIWVAAMVTYLVRGYVAVHRVAAGSRDAREVWLTALAVLVGVYLALVTLADRQWSPALVLPAIHVVAAWRGRRLADRAPDRSPPPPPPAS